MTALQTFRHQLLQARPQLRRYALSFSGDATWADDLVQDAMLKAWAMRFDRSDYTFFSAIWMSATVKGH